MRRQRPVSAAMQPFLDGKVVLIDKPVDWTSFDAIRKVRVLTDVQKVGHAGTLDPLASGLLIICTGSFTKSINEYMGMEKEYTGSITLGATTPTYDMEGAPENFKDINHLTEEAIHAATQQFTGSVMQVPPRFSAIKIDGKRAYKLARKGAEMEIEPRPVTISVFEITKIELPKIYFRVVCSTGTYIRSLANDYGKALGVGGYLSSLRRTRIGNFLVEDAMTPDELQQQVADMYREHA